ncbi:MAG TPA: PQQ-binding-like beta-propeller repeat protein [Candidatus Limnocylindrales bacterium]|nr:PQQ-binding-like beta-propeller repeat protein [Candidatus Limnocylindrales bacterium]
MKIPKNKIAAISIVIFFALSMTASMMLIPNASAHRPAWDIPTQAYVQVAPNPVGIGQQVTVHMWLQEPPPTASSQYGDRWQNFKVIVTKPDGTTETLGPFTSDDTGGTSTYFTPSATGNYTFFFSFPGQTLAGNNPPPPYGFSAAIAAFIGDYYEPSNASTTITVQQQSVSAQPITPLPTSYWQTPVNALNANLWYSISGNWLGLGNFYFAETGMYNSTGNYNPYTTAPATSHIMWTRPVAFGGALGGEFGGTETSNYYTTANYEPKFAPVIMNGILYYTMFPGSADNPAGWAAVDLYTGQTLWTLNTTDTLRCGQILDYVSPNQFGGIPYLWGTTTDGVALQGLVSNFYPVTQYDLFDAMTGKYILSIVDANWMMLTEDQAGNLIGYYINTTYEIPFDPLSPVIAESLNMWNSTLAINRFGFATGENLNSWLWRPPQGADIPFQYGVQWSVPLPMTYSGSQLPESATYVTWETFAINSGVVVLDSSSSAGGLFYTAGWEVEAGYNAFTGAQIWITNRTEPAFDRIDWGTQNGLFGPNTAGNGVYVEINEDTMGLAAYSLITGKQVWTASLTPFNPYDSDGVDWTVANGTIYVWGVGGDVWSVNILTGAINWHYSTGPTGLETPYADWPLWVFGVGTVADGKLYIPEGHEYSPPVFHGAQQLCLNITNGKPIWSIEAFDVTDPPAIADGIMTVLNSYDNQIYAYGKGPTATTVTAPDIDVTTATPVTITGTVMDISSGSQQQVVAANFPHGLPCVSDASMTQFMEAVYEQQPMPTNLTGVPITIYVTDSNHNCYPIGTTTTDPSTGTYGLTWTPIIPGNYTVTATFAGTQSYYGSTATTYFYASSPPPTIAPTTSPPSGLASTGTVELGVAAIIIVIVIIGVAILAVLLRKRP